jgi:hypothetical protein
MTSDASASNDEIDNNDDSDLAAFTSPAAPPGDAGSPPAEPAMAAVEPEKSVMTIVAKEHQRRASTHCRCGALLQRRDKFVIFEFFGPLLSQRCDACCQSHELGEIVARLNDEDDTEYGQFAPVFVVRPRYAHDRCGHDCNGHVHAEAVWPVHRFPENPRQLLTGSCRRHWEERLPKAMAILTNWLGLPPLAPLAPPAPPPTPTPEQIATEREVRHRNDLIDVACAMRPEVWRGLRTLTPADMAEIWIKLIDERVAAAMDARKTSRKAR